MPLNISRPFVLFAVISFAFLFAGTNPTAVAQDDAALFAAGEKVFTQNCGSCHKPDKDMTGPALKGSRDRWDGKGDIYAWVRNSQAYLKTGNEYANALFETWKKSVMTPNALSDEEIDAVLYYADNYVPPAPPPGDPTDVATGPTDGGPSWPWLVVVALIFAIIAASMGGLKRALNNAVRQTQGLEAVPDRTAWQNFQLWAWKNKVFVSVLGLLITVVILVQLWNFAFRIGVYGGDTVAHYKPEQPILFNHTLHAGKADDGNLAINCQYCHSGAEKSKHAGIPSANVCMNCHQAVNEGRSAAGTEEIKKIYAAIGWDGKGYTGEQVPIRWVKVHNLPDHVYFNHAQHVSVGKLECQECHGPIDEKMDVAEQWAPLTMGWCIQCHNDKAVKMDGNGYYDEMQHRMLASDVGQEELKKILEDGKISVKDMGGWECAKCHY